MMQMIILEILTHKKTPSKMTDNLKEESQRSTTKIQ